MVKRNPDYWGEPAWLSEAVYKIVLDPTVKLQLLKKQELDLGGLLPLQWSKQSCGESFRKKFYKASYTTPGYNYIGWNLRKPFFSDKRVRRAMTPFCRQGNYPERNSPGSRGDSNYDFLRKMARNIQRT